MGCCCRQFRQEKGWDACGTSSPAGLHAPLFSKSLHAFLNYWGDCSYSFRGLWISFRYSYSSWLYRNNSPQGSPITFNYHSYRKSLFSNSKCSGFEDDCMFANLPAPYRGQGPQHQAKRASGSQNPHLPPAWESAFWVITISLLCPVGGWRCLAKNHLFQEVSQTYFYQTSATSLMEMFLTQNALSGLTVVTWGWVNLQFQNFGNGGGWQGHCDRLPIDGTEIQHRPPGCLQKANGKLSLSWPASTDNQREKPIRKFSIDPTSSMQTSIADTVFADPTSETPSNALSFLYEG